MSKREFLIPENVSSDYEIFQNFTLKSFLWYLPGFAIDAALFCFVEGLYPVKGVAVIISLALPSAMILARPVRDNIPFYKHLMWWIKDTQSQQVYYYKKEGIKLVQPIQEFEEKREVVSRTEGSTIRTRFHTSEISR
ncbi:hypothetical protein [Fictibacillus sp. NRS-1165]|uniref:hypothetical protein n=1 Tax=Fictibacillus sp. NRS-1165 TaxID=3144463 RepID=UPI003D1DDA7D